MSTADNPSSSSPKPALFYGWVMLGIAIVMAIATMPTQSVVVSLFNDPISGTLSLDLEQLSRAYTIGTICAAIPLPWVGRMADKHGLRVVVGIVCIGCAGALVLLSFAHSLVVLTIAFFFMRFLGQGSLGMLAGHTIAMWFERKLGRAHAMLAVCGFAGGSALMPTPTAWLIGELGWRSAALVLSGFVVLLVLPLVLFLFRNKPEDIGQHLDGDDHEHMKHDVIHGGSPPKNDPGFTRRQAMCTRAYWIIVPIMCANGMIGTALLFHMTPMLRSAGIDGDNAALLKQSALAIQPWPIAFGVSMLSMGWLVDRVKPRHLMPLGPVLMGIACVVCLGAVSGWFGPDRIVAAMGLGMGIFGVAMGVGVAVGNPAIARYFGRTHHGSIRGTISLASVAATGAGPWIAGKAYVVSGEDFGPVLLVFALCGIPLAIGSLFLRPPSPPKDRDVSDPDPDDVDPVQV